MNNWFTVLKDAKQISSTGVKTKLGTKPLTITDEDKFPCCEEARKKALQIIDFREKDFVKEANCEDLYWKIRGLSHGKTETGLKFAQIKSEWGNCVALLPQPHIEEKGWSTDYRDVE